MAKSFIGSFLTLIGFIAASGVASNHAQPMTGRVLLATVSDARNVALVGLGAEDFVIDEGGEAREVFAVNMADYPVVVLIDDGAETPGDFDAIRAATARFVSRIGQRTVVLGTLADPPLLTAFDDDRATVLARLEAIAGGPTSRLLPFQALANAARQIREAETMFSAIVVVQAPRADGEQTWEEPALLTTIMESRAIIHVVTKASATPPPLGRQPAARGDGFLRDLADQTGGQAATIYSAGSYEIALDRVADRLATEMMIEYLVPPGSQAGGAATVGVRIPGARVRGLGVSR